MLRSALLASALLWACSRADRTAFSGLAQGGAGDGASGLEPRDAGSEAGALTESVAGSSSADGGSFGAPTAGGSVGGGGASTEAGSTGADATEGVASGGSAGASGGASLGVGGDTVDLCALAKLGGEAESAQSDKIAQDFLNVVSSRCDFCGLIGGYDIVTAGNFANGLAYYGLALWGCNNKVANDFLLVSKGQKVTQSDGEALVDLYVGLTRAKLLLPESAAAVLREELLALLPGAVAPDAQPISLCGTGIKCRNDKAAGGSGSGGSGGSGTGGGRSAHQGGSE